jgi:hypothetical protein
MNEEESDRSRFEQIQILLHEYDTLRNEIIGRTRDGFTLFSITVALFVGAISLLYGAAGGWPAAATAILGAIAFNIALAETTKGIAAISTWLCQLEARVNALAGEPLLSWETENSVVKKGWFRRALERRRAATPRQP